MLYFILLIFTPSLPWPCSTGHQKRKLEALDTYLWSDGSLTRISRSEALPIFFRLLGLASLLDLVTTWALEDKRDSSLEPRFVLTFPYVLFHPCRFVSVWKATHVRVMLFTTSRSSARRAGSERDFEVPSSGRPICGMWELVSATLASCLLVETWGLVSSFFQFFADWGCRAAGMLHPVVSRNRWLYHDR